VVFGDERRQGQGTAIRITDFVGDAYVDRYLSRYVSGRRDI
jgi:hypothetical protein